MHAIALCCCAEPVLCNVRSAGPNFDGNGPQYTGQAFKTFTETWGITHVTSSPHYARSNGLAERYLRYIKATLKKSSDMQLALLNIRATPVDAKLPSPAEMLLGRPLATLIAKSQRTRVGNAQRPYICKNDRQL